MHVAESDPVISHQEKDLQVSKAAENVDPNKSFPESSKVLAGLVQKKTMDAEQAKSSGTVREVKMRW